VKTWYNIQKKLPKKYQVKREAFFHENTRKYIQILLKFHFETIEPSIGFNVNRYKILKTLE
jgi:lauroyl/myristoyl acyltransferase